MHKTILTVLENAQATTPLVMPRVEPQRAGKGFWCDLLGGLLKRRLKGKSEEASHMIVADWLDAHGLVWCHPSPNAYRAALRLNPAAALRAGAKAKRLGVKAGIPDFLIFSVPPGKSWRGVAVELKREVGGVVSAEQTRWLSDLARCGWMASAVHGDDGAIKFLRGLGY